MEAKANKKVNSSGKRCGKLEVTANRIENHGNGNELVGLSFGRPKRVRKPNPRYISEINESGKIVDDLTAEVKATEFVDAATKAKDVESLKIGQESEHKPSSLKTKAREKKTKYAIDCTATSQIIDISELVNYLSKSVKVEGVKNNFGNKIWVKEKNMKVFVKSASFNKDFLLIHRDTISLPALEKCLSKFLKFIKIQLTS